MESDDVTGGCAVADGVRPRRRRIADEPCRASSRIVNVLLPFETVGRQHALRLFANVTGSRGALELDLDDSDRRRSRIARAVRMGRGAPERLSRAHLVSLDSSVG